MGVSYKKVIEIIIDLLHALCSLIHGAKLDVFLWKKISYISLFDIIKLLSNSYLFLLITIDYEVFKSMF